MTKIFICDECGREFPQPLDEIKYKDEHGDWYVFDFCAPCREDLKEVTEEPAKEYFDKKVKDKKEKK